MYLTIMIIAGICKKMYHYYLTLEFMVSKTFGGLRETLTLYDAKTSKIVHSVLYHDETMIEILKSFIV